MAFARRMGRPDLQALLVAVALLLTACHDGEDHPWLMWEMGIPYSSGVKGGYPFMGPITRYESLTDCQAMRTKVIRNLEQWGPDRELLSLLRGRTWCLPV
jgi:hypothetical protein